MTRYPRATGRAAPGALAAAPRAGGPWSGRLAVLLTAGAVAYGAIMAARRAWLCDDAFISFRYAENLVRGQGLVYNAGERIEGYSNFLWTVWTAIGMRLGAAPEDWSVAWGVVFYAAAILLLCLDRTRARVRDGRAGLLLPLAGGLAAVHPDWQVYATSGLETSLFTCLAILGYQLAVDDARGPRGAAAAGFVMGLVALTRPDGVLFAGLAGLFVLAWRRPLVRSALAFAAAILAVYLPFLAWKLVYYGDLVPNTWYAKSAGLAWYSQGWLYVRLYFQKYWVLAAAPPLALAALLARRDPAPPGRRQAWAAEAGLAAAFALAYTFFVLRVGGDFMYARLLIPATPFFLILLERALARLTAGHGRVALAAAAAALLATAAMPYPFRGEGWVGGIVNEWMVYTPQKVIEARNEGLAVRRYLDGLPVRVAFVGSQAALAYYARPQVAIEAQTGLTDRWIARQPLARRGRVGHEKVAPVSYLIDRRRANFVLRHFAAVTLGLDDSTTTVVIWFDQVPGRILFWDPALLAELKRRGARFPDFPALLDGYLSTLDRLTDAQVRTDYARLKRFYFDPAQDAAREAPLLARLRRSAGAR